ncbi:MAG: hypothetical protein LBH49_01885 [Puniceicoccales bacterium]|nr:hypothetical protein [Puniceicoccales bacterium]
MTGLHQLASHIRGYALPIKTPWLCKTILTENIILNLAFMGMNIPSLKYNKLTIRKLLIINMI